MEQPGLQGAVDSQVLRELPCRRRLRTDAWPRQAAGTKRPASQPSHGGESPARGRASPRMREQVRRPYPPHGAPRSLPPGPPSLYGRRPEIIHTHWNPRAPHGGISWEHFVIFSKFLSCSCLPHPSCIHGRPLLPFQRPEQWVSKGAARAGGEGSGGESSRVEAS